MNRIDKMTDKMPIRAGAKSLMMQSKSDGRERSRKQSRFGTPLCQAVAIAADLA